MEGVPYKQWVARHGMSAACLNAYGEQTTPRLRRGVPPEEPSRRRGCVAVFAQGAQEFAAAFVPA